MKIFKHPLQTVTMLQLAEQIFWYVTLTVLSKFWNLWLFSLPAAQVKGFTCSSFSTAISYFAQEKLDVMILGVFSSLMIVIQL